MKIAYVGGVDVPHWRGEIAAFRKELRRDLSPSLAAALPGELPRLYAEVREVLLARPESMEWARITPPDSPFSWEDLMGRGGDWTPEPATA